jgi:hypothetical protein
MHNFRFAPLSILVLFPITCIGCSGNSSPDHSLRNDLSTLHSLHDDTQAIGSIDATPTVTIPKHHRRSTQLTVRHHAASTAVNPTE